MSLTHALRWSFLSELASKAIQPVVFIVLARLLTPEDFGVMSAALMVIGFSQIFWEAGMGKALIQRQTDTEDAANVAFWINVALGTVIAALLFVVSKPVAVTFFHDDRVTAVLQVMTLQVLLGAISSVHTALLQKEMGFKKLFWVRFATVSLPGLASIPLAWNGMGYWALVAGTLVGQVAQVVMLWRISDWRPQWSFHIVVAKEMGHFGAWVGASGLLAWFYIWADSLIVGMYLGSNDLGIYRNGNQFVILIYSMLFGPIIPVLYTKFSTIIDLSELAKRLMETVSIIALLSIPLAFFLFSTSEVYEKIIFGEKWDGIYQVIAIMSLSHGISYIFSVNGEAYRAAGKPQFEVWPMLFGLVLFLPTYVVSIQYGMSAFLLARLCVVTVFGALIHSFLAYEAIRIKPLFFMGYVFLFALFALPIFVGMVANIDFNFLKILASVFSILSLVILYSRSKHRVRFLITKALR
jgi:O-antigen/teichoic acid export membrane protein